MHRQLPRPLEPSGAEAKRWMSNAFRRVATTDRRHQQECKFFYSRFCEATFHMSHGAIQQLERTMKTVHKLATASAVAFSAFAFVALAGSAAQAAPITPPGTYCMLYTLGGTDCSFTSYAQCEATASGEAAECYGDTVRDDRLAGHKYQGDTY
jgi:hypothetical protein